MKTVIASILIALAAFSGTLHFAAMDGMPHSGHGAEAACGARACDTDGTAGGRSLACVDHCLSAAGQALPTSAPTLLVAMLVAAIAGAAAVTVVAAGSEAFAFFRSDGIRKFVLHRALATVVLRN